MADLEVNINEGVSPVPETIESLKQQVAALAEENTRLKLEIEELDDELIELREAADLDDDDDDDDLDDGD